MGSLIKRGLRIFLFLLVIFIISCTNSNPEIKVETQYVPQECKDDCNEIVLKNEALTNNYNSLVDKYNSLIEERDFWKNEDYKKAQQIELCKNSQTRIPKYRTLYKKTICPSGCDYYLVDDKSSSMLPFFDYNDKLTVYTNVHKEDIQVCDIIGFKTPEHPKLEFVIHQVIEITKDGYITKGIANIYPDDYIIKFEDVMFKFIGVEHQ